MIIKGQINQEYITILIMYAPNKGFKTHEAKTDIETERSIIIVRLQHSIIDRTNRK